MTEPKRPNQRINSFCEEFQVSRALVHKMIRQGRLKVFKVATATIIDGQSVHDLLKDGGYFDSEAA